MNPEEGALRPQIHDRFGLRVLVDGLQDGQDRLEVYRRVRVFREHPHQLAALVAEDTMAFSHEISQAKNLLAKVGIAPDAERLVLDMVEELGISSHRAEITTLEAARAHAAADGREQATVSDVRRVAAMALRQRRSEFIRGYLRAAQEEEAEINTAWSRALEERQDVQ
jgi:magnesium chelatase subunit I